MALATATVAGYDDPRKIHGEANAYDESLQRPKSYPLVAIRVGLPWAPCDSTDNQHDTCLWT